MNGKTYEYVLSKPFPIFDMPPEVAGKLIQLAKEKYGNKAWLVIADLLEKNEINTQLNYLMGKILEIEDRVKALEG